MKQLILAFKGTNTAFKKYIEDLKTKEKAEGK